MTDDDSRDDEQRIATGDTFDTHMARIAVGGYDDTQQVRKAMMNRIRDVVRKKDQGIPFDAVEEEKDDDERDYEARYNDENLPGLIEEMREEARITTAEHGYLVSMLEAARAAEKAEEKFKSVMSITEREPIYTEWLQYVTGVSTTLTARLIHEVGYCEEASRVSELWSYCGLAPGQERVRGEKLGYNPEAKTTAWKVADCLIKMGERSSYRTAFYDPYKEKQLRRMERAEDMTEAQLEEVNWTPPESQGHADARARRYLAKKFLKHYWAIARDLKGLDVPEEWVIAHGGHEEETDTFENPFHAKRELMQPS